MAVATAEKSETKAANLRLEENTWSLLHYLSAVEVRAKADIVEEALRDYAANHQDRIADYMADIARVAGLPAPKTIRSKGSARTAADALAKVRERAAARTK
jgi:predicted DNA-binding protein